MAWSCTACTFENASNEAQRCEICHTQRSNSNNTVAAKTKPKSSKTVQSTLFGGIIAPIKQNDNKNKKRKAAPTSHTQVPLTTVFQQQQRPQKCSYKELKASLDTTMKTVFGIQKLRKLQPIVIKGALKGQSQIVVMATGSGKSLCYQLPAVLLPGIAIVISPLIALMNDQVQALLRKGVHAAIISSANGEKENIDVLERMLQRRLRQRTRKDAPDLTTPLKLVYSTPEQLQTTRFRNVLTELHQKQQLSLLAVDEAHCLSTWGHEFRPAFRKIDWFRTTFPTVPCMACTATATPHVVQDLQDILKLHDAPVHQSSFNRDNIYYKIRYKEALNENGGSAMDDMLKFIQRQHEREANKKRPCSGIIYVHKQEDTQDIARTINRQTGLKAAGYHGGLKAAERLQIQTDWTQGTVTVVVATIAFGMGIDLGHVRYVVHWALPKTVEGFYQESGRAGRDGLPSFSLLYFSRSDVERFRYLIQSRKPKDKNDTSMTRALESLQRVTEYATTACCRRVFLLNHFGEKADPKQICDKKCDFCATPEKVERKIQAANAAATCYRTGVTEHAFGGTLEADWEPRERGNLTVGSLNIDHDGGDPEFVEERNVAAAPSFQKASAVLQKYEAIESKQGKATGFVQYKRKRTAEPDTSLSAPIIPKHLLNAKTEFRSVKKVAVKKTSAEYASEASRLQDELARFEAERNKKLQALQAIKSATNNQSQE